jgi:TolA-binding protein
MKKRLTLPAAILAILASSTYADDKCFDYEKSLSDVFKCFQNRLDTQRLQLDTQQAQIGKLAAENQNQQQRITELENENQAMVDAVEDRKALQREIRELREEKQQLKATVEQLVTKANNWQSGHYCLFANGDCPSGFSRHEGYLRAISLYKGSSTYIKPSTFGSSKIICHGSCGQYGHWTGELHLQICCK